MSRSPGNLDDDETASSNIRIGEKRPGSSLRLPPRKKPAQKDVWVLRGRHVGRVIHAFSNVEQLITSGLQIEKDLLAGPSDSVEQLSGPMRREYETWQALLRFLPELANGLEEGEFDAPAISKIASSIQKGANNARSDDVKSLKGQIIEWVTDPERGLVPPIPRNVMSGRGFRHDATGRELCPAGLNWNDPLIRNKLCNGTMTVAADQWPIFFYQNNKYDPEDPWNGLFRGRLLVMGYKHIFTSPSSVTDAVRATKAGNARIHGMTKVTPASLAYVATLVRFALGSSSTFSRTDTITDSERFYNTIFEFLTDAEEREHVAILLTWWDRQVFPHAVTMMRAPTENSALAKLLEARRRPRLS